ncbi:MAG: LysR family transcriptional regulator [Ruminococcaceae bacterium]|nr:LysR family transcriptional regulator [Oscillospiraceae bacterium]
MNFLTIEYFLTAAEELNFTRAAAKLYISPQSLSSHIAKLEEELGVELFNRTHPMTLTYAGEVMENRMREITDIKRQTFQELRDIKDFRRGVLSVGVSHTRGRVLLPAVLPDYHERFPTIEFKLFEGNTEMLDAALQRGEIDLMISLLPFSGNGVESVEICPEEILMLVPDALLRRCFPENYGYICSRLTENADVKLLKDCPFILMNPGNRVSLIAEEIFEEAKIDPPVLLKTENIETLLELCSRGMGITFYPKTLISDFDEHSFAGIHAYSLKYANVHWTVGVGYMKNRYLPQAAREFIKMLKNVGKSGRFS